MNATQHLTSSQHYYRIGFCATFRLLREHIDRYNTSSLEGWLDVEGSLIREYDAEIRNKIRKVSEWAVDAREAEGLDGLSRHRGAFTVKVVQGLSKTWRNANGQLQHKQPVKGGCLLLAEELFKLYAAFLNKRSAMGLMGDEPYLPPFRVNNAQLSARLRMSGRTIQNWRSVLTRAGIMQEGYYSWHGSNSSYQVMLNTDLIVTEPVTDRGKYFGFLYAVKKEERRVDISGGDISGGKQEGGFTGSNQEITHNFPHTETVLRTDIIQTIITANQKVDNQNPTNEKVGLPEQASPDTQASPAGSQSVSNFFKRAKSVSSPPDIMTVSGKIKNIARQFCEADLLREISSELYGSIWLADSQVKRLKEDIRKLYSVVSDQPATRNPQLSTLHTQYQQRINILKRWISRGSCNRCGWTGLLEGVRGKEQGASCCSDCGGPIKLRYIPLPSSGYWDPDKESYFTTGFGITKRWWKDNQEKNLKARVMGIVKKEANKVIRNPTVDQFRQGEQRLGKLGNEWALNEFRLRVRDWNLLQELIL